ncbi:MAG: ribonuclease III [Clostridiales bacterium]|nr:ribonuclease III [Clostridiales bacterium]
MKFLGYKFKDIGLIERALTHSSKSEINYERLEFLGDSILDFLVGEYFYIHCDEAEGRLTVLRSQYVSENHLAKIFDNLKLAKYVKLGKSYQGEISKAIKGDVVEAVLGAIYLDGGLNEAKNFIKKYFDLDNYKNMIDENYKSKLQELVQGNFKCKMTYQTEPCENGFTSTFCMDEDEIASGEGKSKAEAEQMAAKLAIEKLFLL